MKWRSNWWGVGLATLAAGIMWPSRAQQNAAPPVSVALETEFAQRIKPLTEKYCLSCHAGPRGAGGFNLDDYEKAGEILARSDRLQRLIQYLKTRHMPPAGSPQPSNAEREQLISYFERLFSAGCELADAGRVTLRRLNRVEYRNTIRDLLAVDLAMTDDFPSDDVGYGFDTIGDVLTISPLHMEKYLVAAEKAVALAFPVSQSRVREIPLLSGEIPPSARAAEDGLVLIANGAIPFPVTIERKGAYTLKIRAAQDAAGPEPAQMSVKVNGALIQTINVMASRATPVDIELPVDLEAGNVGVEIGFLNDFYRPSINGQRAQDRNLWIYGLQVVGPKNELPPPSAGRDRVYGSVTARDRAAAKQILERFTTKAWRRPVQPTELDRILSLFDLAQDGGESFDECIQVAITGILCSPHFLFRIELDDRAGAGDRELNDYELAARMSYFIWASTPDDTLLELAKQGKLRDPAVRDAQVVRMLKDPKSASLAEDFVGQWLQLRKLSEHEVDAKVFAGFTPELRSAMMEETKRFWRAILEENRKVSELLTADFTYVNPLLAQHYGISSPGPGWQRVKLPDNRRGLLTQASYLTVTSNPNRTSPVKRGRFVLDNILGTPLPPPPPDVGAIAEDANAMAERSLRERLEAHRANPVCASCHNAMDGIGFALENFDAIGRWRERDGTHAIDNKGELPSGEKFAGAREMIAVISRRQDEFTRYLGQRLLTYGIGRGMRPSDNCHLDAIRDDAKRRGGTLTALVQAVVASEPFRMRAAREPATSE